jgi:hypothetical protein
MGINVLVTEEEIKSKPNYFDLGKLVAERYEQAKSKMDSSTTTIKTKCQNCNRDLSNLDDFDSGGCGDPNCFKYQTDDGYDVCVICGEKSPYLLSTHIDERIGYVEGAGQGCFKTKKCQSFFSPY